MTLETEHNGYKIRYAENEDVWRCWVINLDGKTLSAIKAKINTEIKRAREIDAMPALAFDSSYGITASDVVITLIADEKRVWTLGRGRMGNSKREKSNIENLFADNDENRKTLAEMKALFDRRNEIPDQIKRLRESIPRLTVADLSRIEKESDA